MYYFIVVVIKSLMVVTLLIKGLPQTDRDFKENTEIRGYTTISKKIKNIVELMYGFIVSKKILKE